MTRSTTRFLLPAVTAFGSVFLVGLDPVIAQESDAPRGDALEEIFVTAQRRSERLQDVPISLTALSGEMLAARDITSLAQIDGLAPNFKVVAYYQASPQVAIRGSATTNPSPAFEPTVGLYIDSVYLGKAYGSGLDILDIEQVEVLRGPQGTLYGRNTLAGAINIVTKKPSGEFGGAFRAGYGNYGRNVASGNLDLPAFGALSLKLSALYDKHDGYTEVDPNPFPNVAQARRRVADEADTLDKLALRVAARYEPTDAFTADYSLDFGEQDNLARNRQLTAVGKYDPARYDPVRRRYQADPDSPSYFGGLVGGTYYGYPLDLYVQGGGRADVIYQAGAVLNAVPTETVLARAHALTLTYDLDAATLKSITAYRDADLSNHHVNTATPLPLVNSALHLDYEQFSQELQLAGGSDALRYTAGLYYFHDDANTVNDIEFFTTTVVDSRYRPETDSYAAYGQIDYDIGALTLSGGLRYTDERKSIKRSYTRVLPSVVSVIPEGTKGEEDFSAWTPTVVARYALTDDLNVYAKYSQGFKSGGFNAESANATLATTAYDPEKVSSYEIGAKGVFAGGALSAAIALFFDEHKDHQLSIFRATGGTVESQVQNAGRSEIYGAEIDITARPAHWITLTGGVGYMHAEYKEFYEIDYETQTYGNYADQRAVPNAPEFTAALSADVELVRASWGNLNLVLDYRYSDPYFNYAYSTERGVAYDAYTTRSDTTRLLDARLQLTDVKAGAAEFGISLWVKNATDEDAAIWGVDYGPSFGNAVVSEFTLPRTYGLDVTLRF